jgi:alpha-maltose-1-phosphate synthase
VKILSIIVAHPLRKVSGATNAGLELSAATANLTNLEVALMWDKDEVEVAGTLTKRFFKCTNRLGFFQKFFPRFVRVPLYDSGAPKLIHKGAYDIVHLHNLVPTLAAERITQKCRRESIPYVISTHGFIELSGYAEINGFGKVKSFLVDFVLTRPFQRIVAGAERLFALSNFEFDLLQSMGVEESRIDVVTNGVNTYFLDQPLLADLDDVRNRFTTGTTPILLFFGSLHTYKGVGVFLKSLTKLKEPFQAIVAGRFKDKSEPRMLLDNAGIPANLRQRVRFTGEVSNSELRALYRLADVFVYPTSGDTLPLVILEAMASGLPIVSTTVGGIPFEVTPDCGILVPPGNADAVANAVTTLLQSPETRKAMGARGRKRIDSTFRWENAAKCAVAGYERIMATHGANGSN